MPAYRIRLPGLSRSPDARLDLPERHFHVHKTARDTYQFTDSFFSIRGDVIFENPYQAYVFLNALQAKSPNEETKNLRAAELHAMGLIHEIFHAVIGLYRSEVKPGVFTGALEALRDGAGDEVVGGTLRAFVDRFPPPSVYSGKETAEQFLAGSKDGVSNEQWILEELILLWVGNENPGY